MLVEVEAQPVEFPRPSVEDQGVEVDPPNLDKLHHTIAQLSDWQLFHLSLDRYQEVTLEAGIRSSAKHISDSVLLDAAVHISWSAVPMEVHMLHVHRVVALLHV